MASVWRYSSVPITIDENTAEHSYWVALYAAMIHKEAAGQDFKDLVGSIVLYSVVHDTAECVTGDVVRVFKYSTPELKREVDRAEGILMKSLPSEVRQILQLAEDMSSGPEKGYIKDVVKVADFLSLFQFMRREAMRGNLEIYPFFNRMIEDLDMMASSMAGKAHFSQMKKAEGEGFRPSEVYAAMSKSAHFIREHCFRGFEAIAEKTGSREGIL